MAKPKLAKPESADLRELSDEALDRKDVKTWCGFCSGYSAPSD